MAHINPPRPWPVSAHPAFETPAADWCVVSCFFNSAGFRRPVANLGAFLDWSYAERIPIWMAELAFHDARPTLAESHPRVIQHRMGDEGIMFQKEALLNAVVARLPRSIEYIVFMDADVILSDGAAAAEATVERLRAGSKLVQPFSVARWTDAAGRPGIPKMGTGWAWRHALEREAVSSPEAYHPGFAVAMSRTTFREIGGLYGCPITGTGDAAIWQAALAPYLPPQIKGASHYTAPSPSAWRAKVHQVIGESVGHIDGGITHLYHGRMVRRGYDARHRLLASFNASRDLSGSRCGLPAWTAASQPALRAAMRDYFLSRDEDQ